MSKPTNKTTAPIKICFVSPKTYPLFNQAAPSVFGGAEVDFYFLATELAQDPSFDVSCVVGDFGQPALEQRENVTLIRSVNFKQNPISGARKLWQALHKANAQIYMLETPSLGLPLVACFCKKYNRKLAYRTAHTNETDGTLVKQRPLFARAFLWAIKQAHVVFTQNQEDLIRLKKRFGISAIVTPNGHRIPPLSNQPRDTILWVGRSAAFKNPYMFLDLAQSMPNQHFTMICQKATGDSQYDQLQKKAHTIKNLEFITRVPFAQIAPYFQRARLFVSTSDSEGFPNTFVQACLAATPIISLAVNPDNFLNQYHCGLCAQGNPNTFQQMLRQLLKEETNADYSQAARQYAQTHHNITTITAQYRTAFQNLLKT